MEKIDIIKELSYKGCPILLRRLDTRFEYLISYKKKFYSEYFDIKPDWYRKLFFEGEKIYTGKQLRNITNLLIKVAHATIDKLKK